MLKYSYINKGVMQMFNLYGAVPHTTSIPPPSDGGASVSGVLKGGSKERVVTLGWSDQLADLINYLYTKILNPIDAFIGKLLGIELISKKDEEAIAQSLSSSSPKPRDIPDKMPALEPIPKKVSSEVSEFEITPTQAESNQNIKDPKKAAVLDSFSKFMKLIDGTVTVDPKDDLFANLHLNHSGKGRIGFLASFKYGLLGGTLITIPKNSQVIVEYDSKRFVFNNQGIKANTGKIFGTLQLCTIKINDNGTYTLEASCEIINDKGEPDCVLYQETIKPKDLAYIFSNVKWEPKDRNEKDAAPEPLSEPTSPRESLVESKTPEPQTSPVEEIPVSPQITLSERVEVITAKEQESDSSSMLNRSTLTTIGIAGLYCLGYLGSTLL